MVYKNVGEEKLSVLRQHIQHFSPEVSQCFLYIPNRKTFSECGVSTADDSTIVRVQVTPLHPLHGM